ncbi:MAG: HigA family addiction module antitoxin [Bacteroidales bacterium]|nr:HigA family addiction module antitoxin [Bacteroidales bacterium]
MDRLANIHPGEILLEEFLRPLEITAYRLSKGTDIPQTRISQIIKGKRRITADTALRFSSYFGNSAKFWLGLQDDYDIEEEKEDKEDLLIKIKKNAPQHTTYKTGNQLFARVWFSHQRSCRWTSTQPKNPTVSYCQTSAFI